MILLLTNRGCELKLKTALKNADEIARRIRSVNGLLATPLCDYEAVRISRVWVFGSTVKGSQNPNDLDLLIECKRVGKRRTWKQGKLDTRYMRSYGIRRAISAHDTAFMWMTKGMKMVSRHDVESEGVDIDVKVLIYPRNDLTKEKTWNVN